MPCTGHGTTATFASSSFTANLLDITPHSYERASIETSHMGTTAAHTFCEDSLYDAGTMEMTIEYEGTTAPPISSAAETITMDIAGIGVNNKVVVSGFLVGYSPSVPRGDRMTATLSWKLTGAIVIS